MTVSVVLPTVGRSSLSRAVQSVLEQTTPVSEVIIVADTDDPVSTPPDPRIRVLRNHVRLGPAASRQRGIDAATGSVIALLDDDDTWFSDKLERQLAAVGGAGRHWIASCRVRATSISGSRVWPRHLIGPRDPVADYLFRFTDLRHGGRALQTSTLVFPTDLARTIRWDSHTDAIHDEPSWLLEVARALPDLQVVQLPDPLVVYDIASGSVSRQTVDLTDRYIDWGRSYLASESARVRGDYLCSSPVSAAVAAGTLAGIGRSVRVGLREGRPGPAALVFAALSAVRVLLGRIRSLGLR